MITHNIGYYEEMTKIIFQLSSNIHFICSSEKRLMPRRGTSNEYLQLKE